MSNSSQEVIKLCLYPTIIPRFRQHLKRADRRLPICSRSLVSPNIGILNQLSVKLPIIDEMMKLYAKVIVPQQILVLFKIYNVFAE